MTHPQKAFYELLRQDRRYRAEAYQLVWESLNFAQKELKMGKPQLSEPLESVEEPEGASKPERHVSGQELCHAIREYALRQYGLLAKTVLGSWGIHNTSDFGEIVFNLIRIGHMRRTKDDHREDFDNVYDFDTALEQEYRITMPEGPVKQ
jgi:uncharacterized repeat protein (TIGR04138 family)